MWNDEDNNPYGAFDDQAHLSDSLHSAALSGRKHGIFLPVNLDMCDHLFLTVSSSL